MKIIEVEQGSTEWHAHRNKHRNASDASAMMGASPYVPRNELVKRIATGIQPEFDAATLARFADGHRIEPLGRAMAEKIIADDLYPVVGVHDDGVLSASFDGLTICGSTAAEIKQWNESKADSVRGGKVPPEDYWQCFQQLYVSGAERLMYMVTDGTPEKCVHCWVSPMKREFAALLAGWKQFEQDVLDYKPTETVMAAVAEVQSLPAVSVQVNGSIEIASNLPAFGVALKEFIARIDMKPSTDQAFADAEAAVKTLEKAQEKLEAAKASGLAQVATVDEMVRTVDSLAQLARSTRLALDKMVKGRKDEIRGEIATTAKLAYFDYLSQQNKKLKGRVMLPTVTPDFAGAMKGKKSITSLRSAVDDLMAKAKIEANQLADDYAANIATIDEIAANHQFLIRDLADLVTINPEHVKAVVQGRIDAHEAAEAKRREEEREKIRKEEEARANREAEAKAEKERQKIRAEEQAKLLAEKVATPVPVLSDKAVADENARNFVDAVEAKGADGLPVSAARIYADEPTPIIAQTQPAGPGPIQPQPAHPTLADIGKPRVASRLTAKASRPTDAEIIGVLSQHYRVHESTVIAWLLEMDLKKASAEMAKEFAA